MWGADQAFEMAFYSNFALVLSLWKQQLEEWSDNYNHIVLEKHNLHLNFLLLMAHVPPQAKMQRISSAVASKVTFQVL